MPNVSEEELLPNGLCDNCEAGHVVHVYDSEGFTKYGFNKEGYDREGFNYDGYDKEGYDKDGFDKWGYDESGYNENGYDRQGFDREGKNSKGETFDEVKRKEEEEKELTGNCVYKTFIDEAED